MRSDSKIPEVGTIVNGRKYIGGLESRYSGGHKRNYITVKCMKCGLERHIESKGFWNGGCRCNQLASIKEKHGFCHKGERNRFYEIFCGIKSRCKGTAGDGIKKRYSDKGIKCLWNTFEEFKNDMYESYLEHISKFGEKQTSIDRIDNNGDYCKKNCRWATCTEQNRNRDVTNYVEYNGKKYDAWLLSEEVGISRLQASYRISGYKQGKQTLESLFRKKK